MLCPSDQGVVERDGTLPGLALVLDRAALQEAIAEHFPETGMTGLECYYLRYKPQTNCLAAYRGQAGGQEVQLYVKAYPASRRPQLEHLRDRMLRSCRDNGGPPTHWVIPSAAITIHPFPFDKSIIGLPRLAQPEARTRLLERVLSKGAPELAARAAHLSVRPLTYKAERRFVGALMDAGRPVAVLKLHSDEAFGPLSENPRRIGDGGRGRILRVPRWLGRSRQYRAVATEWMDGRSLDKVVRSPQLDAHAVRRVGTALAELHHRRIRKLPNSGITALVLSLEELADSVSYLTPLLRPRILSLATDVACHLAACEDDHCVTHGDFYSAQVVLQEESASFIDFDQAALGSRSADLGNFIAHLEWDAIRGKLRPERAEVVRQELLQGYGSGDVSLPTPKAIAAYTAAGLLRLIPHPFRTREPHWPRHMEQLLDRIEVALHTRSDEW